MIRANVYKILSHKPVLLLMPTILCCGFALRIVGIGVGLPTYPDPRETLIAEDILKLINFSAVPEIFNWPGTAWFYLNALVGKLLAVLGMDITSTRVIWIARFINVLLSTGTIWFTYGIGKSIYNEKGGLIAAGFLAVSMLHATNESRFALVDIPATFCVTLFLWCLSRDMQWTTRTCIWLGIIAGIGFAVKFSTIFVCFSLLVKFGTDRYLRKLTLIGGVSIVTWTVFCPYWLIDLVSTDWNGFFDDFLYESVHYHRGHFGLFATGETGPVNRFLYLWTLLRWGLGVPLTLLVSISLLFVIAKSLFSIRKTESTQITGQCPIEGNPPAPLEGESTHKNRQSNLLLLAFVLPYLMFIGSFKVSFARHLLLIYPTLTLLAAVFLVSLDKRGSVIIGCAVWLYSFIYTAAFAYVLLLQPTGQETAEWVSANIPHESAISRAPEVLFDWLVPELDRDLEYSDEIADWVIIIQSNWEVFENYLQNPKAYEAVDWFPLEEIAIEKTLLFYAKVLGPKSRYELQKTFKRNPQFLGIPISDNGAPFPMRALIHPEIRIYRLNQRL